MMNGGNLTRTIAGILGSTLRDVETKQVLGKAIILTWGGSIHIIGLTSSVPLRPVVVPAPRLAYWKTTLGFTAPKEPDFPNIR